MGTVKKIGLKACLGRIIGKREFGMRKMDLKLEKNTRWKEVLCLDKECKTY